MTLFAWLGTSSALRLLGDHLWQSTLCAIVAALLALVLKKNRAQVRYALWLTASIKFLIPFGALAALGRLVPQESTVFLQQPQLTSFYEVVGEPFSQPGLQVTTMTPAIPLLTRIASALPMILLTTWIVGSIALLLIWCVKWRRVAILARDGVPIEDGPTVETLRRLERVSGVRRPIAVVSTDASIEPGVFGIVRAALLWPRVIGQNLTDRQVEAILAHEVSHVRRHDNVAAALHMFVQALFWFHPLVWWLGARLIDERERACDEDVIRLGSDPEIYAESILKTCQLCIESPIPCVAGVTGSDLKKRIESIMSGRTVSALASWKKLLLATAGIALVAAPLVHGMRSTPATQLQGPNIGPSQTVTGPSFEVASIKRNISGEQRESVRMQPGGRLTISNNTLFNIIRNAYNVRGFQIVTGERTPEWLDKDHWDIVAKAEDNASSQQVIEMLQNLLKDRFKLVVRRETREMPIYALVFARSDRRLGPQFRASSINCADIETAAARAAATSPSSPPSDRAFCGTRTGRGTVMMSGAPIADFVRNLSPMAGRVVVDKTGLVGTYDLDLKWTFEQMPPDASAQIGALTDGTSLFAAVQEQLGLKLEPQRGPVDVLVIDSADRPTNDFEPRAAPQQPAQAPRTEPAAQHLPTAKNVSFEVASIKPNKSGDQQYFTGRIDPGGRYTITNAPLRNIIRSAYVDDQNFLLENFRLFGDPSWLSDRFDITAKAEGNPSRAQFKVMLRNLLAERFKLVVHAETRTLPIYQLVLARNNGTLGPQLGRPSVDCAALLAEPESKDNRPEPGTQAPCGTVRTARGRLFGRGRPMDSLAGDLSSWVNRVIEDRTGLTGYFDFDLRWTPTEFPVDSPWVNEKPADTGGPSLFTALEEQLGLKLNSSQGPVEVLVIDSVEQPTPD